MSLQKQPRKVHVEVLNYYPPLDPPKRKYYIYNAYVHVKKQLFVVYCTEESYDKATLSISLLGGYVDVLGQDTEQALKAIVCCVDADLISTTVTYLRQVPAISHIEVGDTFDVEPSTNDGESKQRVG